jgi:hypothetical protein
LLNISPAVLSQRSDHEFRAHARVYTADIGGTRRGKVDVISRHSARRELT